MKTRLSVQLSLLFLHSLSALVPAASLAGSCVEAGFTECCDLSLDGLCFAPPTYCLCDPSCHEHGDCCDDIGEICSSAYLQPAQPTALLTLDVTFHTATLLWGIPPDAGPNNTYTIIYWEMNTTLTHNISVEHGLSQQLVWTTVAGLEAGRMYASMVEASNGRAISQSSMLNFTTLSYAKIEELRVELYNSSAVLVSWQLLSLPSGVQLHEYVVHCTNTKTSEDGDNTVGMSVRKTSAIITGLNSDAFYHFWVEAVVMDDTLHSVNSSYTENLTIYVPASALVQFRGGPFKPCLSWTRETELQTLVTFRHFIERAVLATGSSDEGRSEEKLIGEDRVFCDDSTTGRQSQALYRATVYSTPNLTLERVISLIEDRVRAGDVSSLQIDMTCPVRVSLSSQPLCRAEKSTSTDCPKSDPTGQTLAHSLTNNCSQCESKREVSAVTLPVLVTALVAELFVFIVIGMFIIAVTMMVKRRKLLSDDVKVQQQSSANPNTYS